MNVVVGVVNECRCRQSRCRCRHRLLVELFVVLVVFVVTVAVVVVVIIVVVVVVDCWSLVAAGGVVRKLSNHRALTHSPHGYEVIVIRALCRPKHLNFVDRPHRRFVNKSHSVCSIFFRCTWILEFLV